LSETQRRPCKGASFQVRSLGEEMRLVRTLEVGRVGCCSRQAVPDLQGQSLNSQSARYEPGALGLRSSTPADYRETTSRLRGRASRCGRSDQLREARASTRTQRCAADLAYLTNVAPATRQTRLHLPPASASGSAARCRRRS